MINRHFFIFVLLSLAYASDAVGQEVGDPDWTDAYLPIDLESGSLAGPGKVPFLQACSESDYVLFGEAHGVKGIAEFVTATHRALSESHHYVLVLESGDWFTEQLALGSSDDVLRRYPYSLAFDYNGDLQLISQAERMADGGMRWVIGVDQESNAIHVFQYIAKHAQASDVRRLARGLFLKALFQGGRYIRSPFVDDLNRFREALDEDDSIHNIVNSLEDSMSIFTKHIAGDIQASVIQREARMMAQFDRARTQVVAGSNNQPRFLFKMGGAHTVRGIGPNGVETLGEHVAQLAIDQGKTSFHVAIYPWRDQDTFPLPDGLDQSAFVYVDCQKLNRILATESADQDNPVLSVDLVNRLDRCDAIVLIPNAESASKSQIRQLQKNFVRRQLMSVAIVLLPILLLIPVYWSSIRHWFRSRPLSDRSTAKPMLYSLPTFLSVVMIVAIVGQIALIALAPESATLTSGWISLIWDLFCVFALTATLLVGIRAARNHWWSGTQRVVYWIGFGCCLFLWIFIYYWHVGGLMGV